MGFGCRSSTNARPVNRPPETIIVRRNECRSSSSRELPSPVPTVSTMSRVTTHRQATTYHLEIVQFLLDLLSEHGCQAVAGRQLGPTVILLPGPCVVKHQSRAERSVPLRLSRGRARCTLRVLTEPESRHEVVLVANSNRRIGPLVSRFVVGRARSTRHGRVRHRRDGRQFVGRSSLNRLGARRGGAFLVCVPVSQMHKRLKTSFAALTLQYAFPHSCKHFGSLPVTANDTLSRV